MTDKELKLLCYDAYLAGIDEADNGSPTMATFDGWWQKEQPAPDLREAEIARLKEDNDVLYSDLNNMATKVREFAKLKPLVEAEHYSGDASVAFWEKINATKDMNLYKKACKLQELEEEILEALNKPAKGGG